MISDVLLERYLSGELSSEIRARIEAALRADPAVKARHDALLEERKAFFAVDAPAAFAHRVAVAVEMGASAPRRSWLFSPWLAAAAAVMLVVGVLVSSERQSTVYVPKTPQESARELPAAAPEPMDGLAAQPKDVAGAPRAKTAPTQNEAPRAEGAAQRGRTKDKALEREVASESAADDLSERRARAPAPRIDIGASGAGEAKRMDAPRPVSVAPRGSAFVLAADGRRMELDPSAPLLRAPGAMRLVIDAASGAYAVFTIGRGGEVRPQTPARSASGRVTLDFPAPSAPLIYVVVFGPDAAAVDRRRGMLASDAASGTEIRIRVVPE